LGQLIPVVTLFGRYGHNKGLFFGKIRVTEFNANLFILASHPLS